jgi:hypothetical protein
MDNKKGQSLVMTNEVMEALAQMGIHHGGVTEASIVFQPADVVKLRIEFVLTRRDFEILGLVLGGCDE